MPCAIIFLDVDGVLNSRVTRERGDHWPDQTMLSHLRALVAGAGGAGVVLSSTWRLDESLRAAVATALAEHGLSVDGCTPDFETPATGDRVDEIFAWLRKHRADATPWLALDDIDLVALNGKLPHTHFVRTKDSVGLTASLADECVAKLRAQQQQQQRQQQHTQHAARRGHRDDGLAVVGVGGAEGLTQRSRGNLVR